MPKLLNIIDVFKLLNGEGDYIREMWDEFGVENKFKGGLVS